MHACMLERFAPMTRRGIQTRLPVDAFPHLLLCIEILEQMRSLLVVSHLVRVTHSQSHTIDVTFLLKQVKALIQLSTPNRAVQTT